MNSNLLELPPLHYGAVKMKRPSNKPFFLWIGSIVVLAAMLVTALLVPTEIMKLDTPLGNRRDWSWSEIAWTTFIISAVAWCIYSMIVWSEPDDVLNEEVRNGRVEFVSRTIIPWLKENYDVDVRIDDAIELYRGGVARVYRFNQSGQRELVRVRIDGIYGLICAAEPEYRSSPGFYPDEVRLLIMPDPTRPPAPFEFENFEQKKEVAST